jgi:hypothetical protein
MIRSSVVFKFAFFTALALPCSLAAQTRVDYQPHYSPSLQDAASQLQSLMPHLAPVVMQTNGWILTNDYTLARVDVSKLGIKLYFSKSPAQQIQFFWNWNGAGAAPPYAPYTGDIITSMVFANVVSLDVALANGGPSFSAPWCVIPGIEGSGDSNSILCINSRQEAQQLEDVLATLVVASGGELVLDSGLGDVNAIAAKYLKKYPNETGGTIASLTPGGAPALAGIQAGDILHAVNGKPYVVNQGMMSSAVREVTWHKPGGVVHMDIFRNHAPMSMDVRYTKPPVDVAKLQQQGAEMIQQAGAPSSGVHFGFQVRPVIQDDMAPLSLTKAQGLVVVSVENGSLADTMGVLAGDVILQVNGADVGDMQQFVQTVRNGVARSFRVWRKGKTVDLTVPVSM